LRPEFIKILKRLQEEGLIKDPQFDAAFNDSLEDAAVEYGNRLKCVQFGCRNLERRCKDCGRNTIDYTLTEGMKRQRVEDLGRIAELLRSILDGHLFEERCNKHNPQPWDAEKVDEFMMGFENLRGQLDDVYQIARYGDETE